MTRFTNAWIVTINLLLALFVSAIAGTTVFELIGILVTGIILCVTIAILFAAARKNLRSKTKVVLGALGTALLWSPVYTASPGEQSKLMGSLFDISLFLGCALLIIAVIWPEERSAGEY